MKIEKLLEILNREVPFNTAESWDNVGLLIGDKNTEITGILTTLDCTDTVVQEAISQKCNTIIAHHPLIFKGIKSILNDEAYGSILYQLIQNNINLIALHTNLDVHPRGTNYMLAQKIGLNHISPLNPAKEKFYKVQVFIPNDNAKLFKDALHQEGIAREKDYEYCFFNSEGIGQFKPMGNAQPTIGKLNQIESVKETKLEFMVHHSQYDKVIHLIHTHHPYEVPVYDFLPIERYSDSSLGVIGELDEKENIKTFIEKVKIALNLQIVKFTGDLTADIKKVAIIGGSGIGFEYKAQSLGADLFITGDIKHHEALDARINHMNLLDISHYSEYVIKEGLVPLLEEWTGIEYIQASKVNTDPFNYL
ncbi:Nif3-like dinuclear metal center hexameric protein [Staphylococcus canis]|uniref:GTP cyclohydrolase 1 type 2 homolog n=1 Tax=Staphylococcus canis TaxID=2724942 RepID=A0ABS0TAA4_9STAP|nr:Nif3-like dinuclear metal center hexameric protein [Staphylococcus canis]MBI5975669.1 Nif3-like dinuclear metal center hexameric protein [Staphylococcus canis]